MAGIVIVGAQWGDEGKGKITDLFAEHADLVIRFQGGNNAGHTIVNTRYEDGRALLLTTNLDHDALTAQIGARTVSRLYEMCGRPLPMFGEDERRDRDFVLPAGAPAGEDEDAFWEGGAPASRYGRRAGGAGGSLD